MGDKGFHANETLPNLTVLGLRPHLPVGAGPELAVLAEHNAMAPGAVYANPCRIRAAPGLICYGVEGSYSSGYLPTCARPAGRGGSISEGIRTSGSDCLFPSRVATSGSWSAA